MIKEVIVFALAVAPLTDEGAAKRVYRHLAIHDPGSALEEAKQGLLDHPTSIPLQKALITALCSAGLEVEAIEAWEKLEPFLEDPAIKKELIETLAWGMLNKGEESFQLNVRLTALMGAAHTRDVKALPLLQRELSSSNAFLRSIAVRLAAAYGDAPLKDRLLALLSEEKVWYVRLEVIRSIARLQMREAAVKLKQIIAHPRTLLEERGEAMIALVTMYDAIAPEELQGLLRSNRAGLRHFACQIIAHLDLKERAPDLVKLLQDSSPEVRMAALNALGFLNLSEPQVLPLLSDSSPEVAITAAWQSFLHNSTEGEAALKNWIQDPHPKHRRLAAAALATTGTRGVALAYQMLCTSSDPFVKANLAIGLIGQREHVEVACDTLFAILTGDKEEKWMWDADANSRFRSLAPSRVRHIEQIPHYPLVVDQMARLEILSILSVMRHPQALIAVKSFLQNQSWGASGAAAATLLEEGDEEALTLVRALLEDPDEKIRVQAALILALMGSDPVAVGVLQSAYPALDRDLKLHVLEALGHIGDPSSIPFLLEIFKEPFQVLRVVAASALIQCLYH